MSGFLIAWLIKPVIAVNLLKIILKLIIFVGIPILGVKLINKLIKLENEMAWKIIIIIWLIASVGIGYWIMKLIDTLFI